MNAKLCKHIYFFLILFLFLACNREEEKWAYYNQTQCADPWGPAQSDNELLVGLANFFNSINVQTNQIVFSEDHALHVCASCGCFTGKVIEVKATESNINILAAHGFIAFKKEN
ncbi:MAG: hypothetical protein JJT77_03275 [Crocinitomicaceae bacterium]|nr:hypothetical protein [Crocinitomicaceae bacterium]